MPKGRGYGGPIKGNNYSGTSGGSGGGTIHGTTSMKYGPVSPTGYAKDGGGVNVRAKPTNIPIMGYSDTGPFAVGDGKPQGFGGYGPVRSG